MMHVVLGLAAGVFWLPVVNRQPQLRRYSYPQRMLYLAVQSLVPAVPASLLTFSTHSMYHSSVTDQQIGGAIMKIGGGLILWTVLGYTFFRWFAEDVSSWDELLPLEKPGRGGGCRDGPRHQHGPVASS
jgi:cytochrome c oxidase assembly factor CtaG